MPLQIIRQDITKMRVDAIVNTTNEEMVGYSGVDLAVHEGAGPLLDAECAKLAPLGLGTAKITRGYNLDAKYIIHTSGPVWNGGLVGESIILKSCYIESLKLAVYSLVEENKDDIKERARYLVENRLAHFVGSDAHRINYRSPKYESGVCYIEEHCGNEYLEEVCYKNADSFIFGKTADFSI